MSVAIQEPVTTAPTSEALPSQAQPEPAPAPRPWGLAFLAPLVLGAPLALLGLVPVSVVVVVLLLAVSVVTDLMWRRIYNWTTYTAVVWGVGLAVAATLFPDHAALFTPLSLVDSVSGLLLAFAISFLAYLIFRGGAGDVKLVAALGALLGPSLVLAVLFYGYIFAGAFAIAYIVWQVGPLNLVVRSVSFLAPWLCPPAPLKKDVSSLMRQGLPMGPFFAAAVVAAVLLS
jgi:prepilin peptidase CpaA